MVSTRRPSRAEQAASNAWLRADGGFIFADARECGHIGCCDSSPISMHRNITPPRVTRLSRASSRASTGFTTIVLKNFSPARSFPLLTRIRRINRCRDRPERCLQTGKRCFTNRARLFGFRSLPGISSLVPNVDQHCSIVRRVEAPAGDAIHSPEFQAVLLRHDPCRRRKRRTVRCRAKTGHRVQMHAPADGSRQRPARLPRRPSSPARSRGSAVHARPARRPRP